MNTDLKNWEGATNELTKRFIHDYFGKADWHWVADKVGEVLSVNDYFFDIVDICSFMRYRYSKKAMFEYYDYRETCREKKESPLNIYSWRHLKK